MKPLRIVLIAENISLKMGGEAAQTLIYFRKFRERNMDVRAVCHARVKEELEKELSTEEYAKVIFIDETFSQRILWKVGKHFQTRFRELLVGQMIHLLFQIRAKKTVRKLVRQKNIDIVFQPVPNTPKVPSNMHHLGVPVILGPMKGGMTFPPAFQHLDSVAVRLGLLLADFFSYLLNRLIPGKLLSDILIVGDEVTKKLLPRGYRGQVYTMLECGVDLTRWKRKQKAFGTVTQPVRFVFTGRLVDWKGVHFLLEAFQIVCHEYEAFLEIAGDGPLMEELKAKAASIGLRDRVRFHGWLRHEEMIDMLNNSDVFVMSSIRESCGCSILEAMALAMPVIAVDWGGPARIVSSESGILIKPHNHQKLVTGIAEAMKTLAESPELRIKMGNAGRTHLIAKGFDWDTKIDWLIKLFMTSLKRKCR